MIYFIRDTRNGFIKIGTSEDPGARLRTLQTGNASPLELIATMPGGPREEAELHRRFDPHRLQGEWFAPADGILSLVAGHDLRRAIPRQHIKWQSEHCPPLGNRFAALVGLMSWGPQSLMFAWELAGCDRPDGSAHVVGVVHAQTGDELDRGPLRRMLSQALGHCIEDGDVIKVDSLLGRGCLLHIGIDELGSECAMGVAPLPDGLCPPRTRHEPFEWHPRSGREFVPPPWRPYLLSGNWGWDGE